jgi:hypothetical protein
MIPHKNQIGRISVIITLAFGIFLHGYRLFHPVGFARFFTPQLDAIFTIPIVISIAAVIATWRHFRFRNRFERGAVLFTLGYFVVSMPLHFQTWFTRNVEYIAHFPEWYSVFFILYSSALIGLWITLEVAEPESS